MATIVNARDVQLQASGTRLLGVTMNPNIQVSQANVTGLGLVVDGTKQVIITATSQLFQIAKSGAVSPSSITLYASVRNLTGTLTLTIPSGGGTMNITPTLTGGAFTFTESNMTSDTVTLLLKLVETGTGNIFTDTMTFVKVREGADAPNGYLTNEAASVPADYLGNVVNYAGASGQFKVYLGLTDVTTACTFSLVSNPDGVGYSLTTTGGSAGAYAITGTGSWSNSSRQTSITIRATFGSLTLDKIFVLTKSVAGTNGTNGSAGSRGSYTFYVAIAGTTWSNSTATTAASLNGGPVLNDVVTEYNSGAGFSQTRFWDGSSWLVINAVVDGNLVVSGTIGAGALRLNNGGGNNLWYDASYDDPSAWVVALGAWGTVPDQRTITSGLAGGTVMRSPTGTSANARGIKRVAVTIGKQYRISVKARRNSVADGVMYVRLDADTAVSGAYTEVAIGLEGITLTTGFLTYAVDWTATTPFVSPMVLLNYAGTAGYNEVQDIRIEEKTDSALIVSGGITADRIDTRNLSIKDGAGNVLFAAGTNIDYSLVNPSAQWLGGNLFLGSLNSNTGTSGGGESITANATGPEGYATATRVNLVSAGNYVYYRTTGLQPGFYTLKLKLFVTSSQSIVVSATDMTSWTATPQVATGTSGTATWNEVSLRIYTASGGIDLVVGAHQSGPGGGAQNSSPATTAVRIADYRLTREGFSGDLNSTYGATIGTNLSGTFSSANISTYMAAATIGLAQINTASITNLQALSATIGTLRTATSGERVEIRDNKIYVYDSANTLRVKIGDLT